MAYDLTNTLVIGISSTALFNMQEALLNKSDFG